jgi:hypothetical protein
MKALIACILLTASFASHGLELVRIKNADPASGMCVEAAGATVVQRPCGPADAQKWNAVHSLDGTVNQWEFGWGDQCIRTVDNVNGSFLTLGACGDAAAKWAKGAFKDGAQQWVNRATGKCMDLPAANKTVSGQRIAQWQCADVAWHRWITSINPSNPPSPPACWPKQVGGAGTPADWVRVQPDDDKTAYGYALWWHCRNAYDVTQTVILTCDASKLWSCLTPDVSAAMAAPSGSKLAALWAIKLTHGSIGSPDFWIHAVAWQDHIKQDRQLKRPVWTVASNRTLTTRPAYPLVNGVRSTTSTARALVAATCDCSVRAVEGTATYCAHDSGRVTVALCRRISE